MVEGGILGDFGDDSAVGQKCCSFFTTKSPWLSTQLDAAVTNVGGVFFFSFQKLHNDGNKEN